MADAKLNPCLISLVLSLADEIAEPRPDMNIKVAALQ